MVLTKNKIGLKIPYELLASLPCEEAVFLRKDRNFYKYYPDVGQELLTRGTKVTNFW